MLNILSQIRIRNCINCDKIYLAPSKFEIKWRINFLENRRIRKRRKRQALSYKKTQLAHHQTKVKAFQQFKTLKQQNTAPPSTRSRFQLNWPDNAGGLGRPPPQTLRNSSRFFFLLFHFYFYFYFSDAIPARFAAAKENFVAAEQSSTSHCDSAIARYSCAIENIAFLAIYSNWFSHYMWFVLAK